MNDCIPKRGAGLARATLAAAAAATLLAPLAEADEWYVRGAAGMVFLGDDDSVGFTDADGTQGVDASFDAGFSFGGGIGRWFGDRWRADVDFTYRSNDHDTFRLDDGRVVDDGNFASTALSVNGYYHFADAFEPRTFSPYVGVGIAYVNEIDIDLEGSGLGDGVVIEDLEDDGVGFQLIGGVSWRQNDRLRWEGEVRWLSFGDADLTDDGGNRVADIDYDPFGVYVGLSYEF